MLWEGKVRVTRPADCCSETCTRAAGSPVAAHVLGMVAGGLFAGAVTVGGTRLPMGRRRADFGSPARRMVMLSAAEPCPIDASPAGSLASIGPHATPIVAAIIERAPIAVRIMPFFIELPPGFAFRPG